MKKYTTLLFDADNTLMDFYAAEEDGIKNTCLFFGIDYTKETGLLYSSINDSFWKRFEKGEIRREEIKVGRFREFIKAIGADIDSEIMAAKYIEELSNGKMLLRGALPLCQKLCLKYDMYIITNGNSYVQNKRYVGSGLEPYFKKIFISEDMGVKKPDKDFFDKVLAEVSEPDKSKICIIGDSMSSDILGGINAGIDTCFFNRLRQAKIYQPTYEVTSFEEMEKLFYE